MTIGEYLALAICLTALAATVAYLLGHWEEE